jgi:hypothetical protein
MVTVVGGVANALFVKSQMVVPPMGALLVRVTLPSTLVPPGTEEGVSVKLLRV